MKLHSLLSFVRAPRLAVTVLAAAVSASQAMPRPAEASESSLRSQPAPGSLLPIGESDATELDVPVKMIFSGSTVYTAASGYAGGYKTLIGTSNYQGVGGIEWWEQGDEPCKIKLTTKHLNNFDVVTKTALVDPCSSPGNYKGVGVIGNANFIYKVQVCTTDKNDTSKNRLKGVRIWTRTIEYKSPPGFKDNASPIEKKHTNCAKWHAAVACGAKKLGVGLRAHYNGDFFTGLALACREVVVK